MRTWALVCMFTMSLAVFCFPLAAQTNPVPYVNNPLVPEATLPGGPQFTLTVNGAGFVDGAVVKWNGSPRATAFVSPTQVTAAILASDITSALTVFITVVNPSPGGGISNSVFFQVTTPVTTLAFNRTDEDFPDGVSPAIRAPTALSVFDPLNLGALYLGIANATCPLELNCIIEKSSLVLAAEGVAFDYQTFTGVAPYDMATGDFNGDGLPDIVTFGDEGYSILLNVSTRSVGPSFSAHADYLLPSGCSAPFVLGDFNGDGQLDLGMSGTPGVCILPGNGDGTFGSPISTSGTETSVLATGDFNGDGRLDLIVSDPLANSISAILGNGDGTFQSPIDVSNNSSPNFVIAADFDGDGRLDLAVVDGTTLSIFLGNGNGTFQPGVNYPAGVSITGLTFGDYNGDGVLDLAVSDSLCASTCPTAGAVNVLLGKGDGTFESPLTFANGGEPVSIVSGEFEYNGEVEAPIGRSGFATANKQASTVSVFAPIPQSSVSPMPTISSISPSSAAADSGSFTLTVNGTNFTSTSTVYFGDQARVTTFISATLLTAAI